MVAFGAAELLALTLMGSGGTSNDFVSFIDAKAYFDSRNIPVTVAKMAELAVTPANDGKAQIQQLLALRTLAADAAKVKEAKNYKEILQSIEAVARGSKANDPQGFASDYAKNTAAALGSTTVEKALHKLPENSVRQDALAWFPTSVTLVAAVDFRLETASSEDTGKSIRDLMAKFMRPQDREEMFTAAEQIGNIRLDRYAFGFAPDAQNPRASRIYMRVTGKADGKRLVAFFQKIDPRTTVQEQKGFRGQKVTILDQAGSGPTLAVVGDTDLLVAGFEGLNAKNIDVLNELLAVRAGKDKSVLTGPLEESLKKTSPRAGGILVGELPADLRNGLTRGKDAFRVAPRSVVAEFLRNKGNLDVRAQAPFESDKDAATFAEDVDRFKKMGIDGVKKLQAGGAPLPFPANTLDPVLKTLESIKAEAKGSTVQGRMVLPGDAVKNATLMMGMLMPVGLRPQPPPVTIKNEAPKIKKEAPPPPQPPAPKKGGDQSRLSLPAGPAPQLTFARVEIACLHEYLDRR